MFCQYCGRPNDGEGDYCAYCGKAKRIAERTNSVEASKYDPSTSSRDQDKSLQRNSKDIPVGTTVLALTFIGSASLRQAKHISPGAVDSLAFAFGEIGVYFTVSLILAIVFAKSWRRRFLVASILACGISIVAQVSSPISTSP
jgi:hypothetical protein